MIPVFMDGDGGRSDLTYDQVSAALLSICQSHRQQGRAHAFAFIFFDFCSPEVVKVLEDPEYWQALHVISGNDLTVFSIHARHPHHEPDRMSYMVSVSPSGDSDGRQLLARYFGLRKNIRFPVLVFFQVTNDSVTGAEFVQLKADRIEDSYIEIRDLLKLAAAAVSAAPNKDDPTGVFEAICRKLREREIKLFALKCFNVTQWVARLIGVLK